MVARMFAKGTQGRANKSRQLLMEAAGVLEEFGPKILSTTQLERARVASAHGKRGLSKAASAAETRHRTVSPKGKFSSPPAKRLALRSWTKTPERGESAVLTLTSAPGVKADVIHPVFPKRTRQSTRSPIARKNAQAASAAVRTASPSITPEERANIEMRAKASAGKRALRVAAISPVPIAGAPP